jgi:predicted phosphodiesterase
MIEQDKVEMITSELDLTHKVETIIALGDLHHGNQSLFDRQRELEAIKHIGKHPDWKVLINGDYIDCQQYGHHPNAESFKSVDEELIETSNILKPIMPQIYGITQGNHEERIFREPSGRGNTPNTLYGHFSLAKDIQEKYNDQMVYAPLGRGVHINLNTLNGEQYWVMKHGHKAGKTTQNVEFDNMAALYPDVSAIILGHTHNPSVSMRHKVLHDKNKSFTWFIRGGAYTSWLAYQEKHDLPPAPVCCIKMTLNNGKLKQPEFVF